MDIATNSRNRPAWPRRMAAAIALALLAGLAAAQGWGLQWRDAPDGRAAEVLSVQPGSAAAAAGLRAGDRIVQAQGFLVRNAEELLAIARMPEARNGLLLRVARDGWEKDVSLLGTTVAAAPAVARPWIGLQLADPAPGADGAATAGAEVTGVAAGGPAAQAGLRAGDLIVLAEARPVADAAQVAALLADWPAGKPLHLGVRREGWARELTVFPAAQPGTPEGALAAAPAPAPPPTSAPAAAAVPAGHKALVSIGDFQVKAATANRAIGDGLREMLVTAFYNAGPFAVVERMDLQGLAAEQALSRSRMAREGAAVAEQRMDVAEIIVYGAVTEFEGEAKGSSGQINLPGLLGLSRSAKTAHMALDVRVVDVASGRVLGAQRIAGDARSSQTAISAEPSVHGLGIPIGLGMYANTPMEAAIRSCIEQAVAYVAATVPPAYFRHR
ncbi:CsgG/HfaB family protein [Aquabacterium sp.]|uniref:CsgG/HfaB family protein n=1 Tax=Aquabacterium sp. TaxID=1872578 RepID=UPI00378424B4